MKKVFIFLFLISFALIPHLVFALTVTVSDATGLSGQRDITVTVNVKGLESSKKIFGIDLCLDYNEKALSVTKVSQGALTSDWNILLNTNQSGKVKIGLYSVKALKEKEGAILVVTFAVKDKVSSRVTPLRLSLANFNEKPAEKIIDGKFKVSPKK